MACRACIYIRRVSQGQEAELVEVLLDYETID